MNETGVWCVVWQYRGASPYIDFWERDSAFAFAQAIAESADRCDPQVFQHETPELDPEVKKRIDDRIARATKGRALMESLEPFR